jgi:hypothetical protein
MRKTARWQKRLDDRILEYLRDESLGTAKQIARCQGVHATENQAQERLQVLADANLLGFITRDCDYAELDTRGRLYLEGEIDVELGQDPRHPRAFEGTQS